MSSKGSRGSDSNSHAPQRLGSPLDVCKDLQSGVGINQDDISTKVTVLTITQPTSSARGLVRESFKFKAKKDYTFDERYNREIANRPVRPDQDKLDGLHITRIEALVFNQSWNAYDLLYGNVHAHPHKEALLWTDENGEETERKTYGELWNHVHTIAAHLHLVYKLRKGDRVLLVYEPCLEFFYAFWACVSLGILAVPVCPPDPFAINSDLTDKLWTIAKDSKPRLILTSQRYKDSLATARLLYADDFDTHNASRGNIVSFATHPYDPNFDGDDHGIPAGSKDHGYFWVASDKLPEIGEDRFIMPLPTRLTSRLFFGDEKTDAEDQAELADDTIPSVLDDDNLDDDDEYDDEDEISQLHLPPTVITASKSSTNGKSPRRRYACFTERDIAFLQYTSGSTGEAKGVMVHHRMLMTNALNCLYLTQGVGNLGIYQKAIGVSWLPTFHDMGLIGFHIAPMCVGGAMVYFSPINFIQNPLIWLQIISRFRHVNTGAPPFALDLICKRITDKDKAKINLSGIDNLVLGAEPIRSSQMELFAETFADVGFRPETYITCYGMAENVLHVAGKWSNLYPVRKINVLTQALQTQGRLVVVEDSVVSKPSDNTTTTSSTTSTSRKDPIPPLSHTESNVYSWDLNESVRALHHQSSLHSIKDKKPSGKTSPHHTSDHNDDNDDGESSLETQWLVSSGELIPFITPSSLVNEIAFPKPSFSSVSSPFPSTINDTKTSNDKQQQQHHARLPHLFRRELASHLIIVNPDTLTECEDGQVGEIWVYGPSKTMGYFNKPSETNLEQFHAQLAKPVKKDTIALIDWVENTLPKLIARGVVSSKTPSSQSSSPATPRKTGSRRRQQQPRAKWVDNKMRQDALIDDNTIKAALTNKNDKTYLPEFQRVLYKNDRPLSTLSLTSTDFTSIPAFVKKSRGNAAAAEDASLHRLTLDIPSTKQEVVSRKLTPLWLRTGDMGVIYDNHIFITGRRKDMLILRGQNYYAEDLEHAVCGDHSLLPEEDQPVSANHGDVASLSRPQQQLIQQQQVLQVIRSGHVVAYPFLVHRLNAAVINSLSSISSTSGKRTSPGDIKRAINDVERLVVQNNLEGEHLSFIVELNGADVIHPEKLPLIFNTNGTAKPPVKTRPISIIKKKLGNQQPLWQRVLTRYSEHIIGGLSAIYEDESAPVHTTRTTRRASNAKKSSTHSKSKRSLAEDSDDDDSDNDSEGFIRSDKPTCNEKVQLYIRQLAFSALRYGLQSGQYVSQLIGGGASPRTSSSNTGGASSSSSRGGESSTSKASAKRVDSETKNIQEIYSEPQLKTVAATIRRVISTKFLLPVGKITFVSPKTIKKTSSGKKRRSETTKSLELGDLDHRIVYTSYTSQLTPYVHARQRLVDLTGDVSLSFSSSSSNSGTDTIKSTPSSTKSKPTTSTYSAAKAANASSSPSSASTYADDDTDDVKFGGTVGVSLHGAHDTYQHHQPVVTTTTTTTSTGNTRGILKKSSSPGLTNAPGIVHAPAPLLPPCDGQSDGNTIRISRKEAEERLSSLIARANAISVETARPRVFRVIAREINAIHQGSIEENHHGGKDTASTVATEEGSFDITTVVPGSLTTHQLEQLSKLTPEEQQAGLDDFGLDSITGFKLGQALAEEFELPPSIMGPHLFLNDPTLDGVVIVMTSLVKLQASKAQDEFNKTFPPLEDKTTSNASSGKKSSGSSSSRQGSSPSSRAVIPSNSTSSSSTASNQVNAIVANTNVSDLTTAQVFRGTTDPNRIPYVLGIGTAVPFSCAPQQEVIEAMLGSMKMDRRSSDRFRKIGENSGVGTRYSVLDDLGQLFWGKEGINLGNDEYVDARQEVYKRESVKLSIKSTADCMQDWLGVKVPKTDQERDEERMQRFLAVEQRHKRYIKHKEKQQEALAKKNALAEAKKNRQGKPTSGDDNTYEELDTSVPEDLVFHDDDDDYSDDISHLAKAVKDRFDRTITHIVAVTCTGIIVPGLEFHIMQALGLPLTTQRLPITFAGCYGAISGLRTASALAAEHPHNRVLVICTELCTLHMQLNDKIDNLIASALFADGSGSFVVGCAPTPLEKPLYRIDQISSFIIPNTVQHMAWESTKSGMIIGLAKEIASEIFQHIGDFVSHMLQYVEDPKTPGHRISAADCNCAIHPGGPLIINTIQQVFGIPQVGDGHGGGTIPDDHPVAETWKILREYGNMSSATLVFVLDRIRERKERSGKPTVTVAFGPGLAVEGALLHRL